MKEMYAQLGISSEVYDFGHKIEESLKERFEKFDKTAEYNQMKVLLAMQKNKVSAECFGSSSGSHKVCKIEFALRRTYK